MFEKFPTLQTRRLNLIEIKQNHLSDIFQLFSDEKVTEFYNIIRLSKIEEAQKIVDWFHNRYKDNLGIRWGISLKDHNSIIGTIGYNNFTPKHRANIGYDLQSEYWNNGYITEALRTVIKFGFNQLQVNRIEAEVMEGNIISEKVLDKVGFQNEGTLRDWMFWNDKYFNMKMFSLLHSDFVKLENNDM
ncbi:GNAT family N-acetyltransferase [Rhizosphaericola mali]|uniref:GNAT family N-acetyltransferase n=1 Tax=Rhizosphaericola mali TaxID=2545455 RepID=A0A5P2G396_9BACT|nr:GNAT family protein [Rhizosphaericola mali]QES88280.1 GNAT family N-acetyltransferase [Rhizosphaericola mali]